MKKHYVLAIILAASMRLQAQTLPGNNGFGPQQVIVENDLDRPTEVFTADLDGDGDQDMLTNSSDKIVWYENDGAGSFGAQQVITTQANGARSIYAADLDGDGDQDVLSASSTDDLDDKIAWYENDGAGNFGEQQVITTQVDSPGSVYAIDLDGDGDQDVLSASANDDKVAWYENDGTGSFGEQRVITTQVDRPRDIYATDLDGDGDQDVLAASSDALAWYENDGSGSFGEQQVITTQVERVRDIYATDLDGDGDQDVLSASADALAWYENDGTGSFDEQQMINTQGDLPSLVYAIDLDGDGDQDVLSASDRDDQIVWYENGGAGNFGEQQVIATQVENPQGIYGADLDGDGDQDVLSASYSTADFDNRVAWYENDGEGNFGEQQMINRQANGATSVYAADLDGDGDQDVLSASSRDNKIAWYESDGAGGFIKQQVITTQANGASSVYAADLDGDGDQDVLSASSRDDKIAWYENDGAGNFGEQQVINTQVDGATSVYAADLDGDGDQDVLSTSFNYSGNSEIAWYENDGAGSFAEQPIITSEVSGAQSVYATDLDGDGDQDVLSASRFDEKIAWYENDGAGNFGEQQVISTQVFAAQSVYAADLDGDGDQDVLSASRYDNKIAWYENDGAGSFGEQRVITTQTQGATSVYTADLDGDGDQDVLSASEDDGKVAWYENGGAGNFGEQQVITTRVNGARSVYTTDLDGDGDQDVLSASFYDGKVAWYENILSQPLSVPTITTLTLFNARTDREVQPLTDGLALDLLSPEPNLYDYNVAAKVDAAGEEVTRVVFELDAPDAANQDTVRTERKAPYVLFGHLGQDYREVQAYVGDYTLTATPYYQDSTGTEVAGVSQTVNFSFVTLNLDIRNPRLVDTRSGEVIESLEAGDVLSLAADQPVSVLVDTRFPEFNSVEFFLDGPNPDGQAEVLQLENLLPYSLFGDGGRNTAPDGQPLAEGEYELRVIAYSDKNRDGYAGPQTVIPFSVVHEASEGESLAYPVPFTSELNLRMGAVDLSQTRIQLVHSYGQVYEVLSSQVQATEEGLRINVAHLPTGPYTIHVQQADGVQTFRASKR